MVEIYTDGAARGNPGPGGYGVVMLAAGHRKEISKGYRLTTNNRMELTGLIEALKSLPTDANLTVYTDSNLCVQTINLWASGWAKNGWKRKTGPIANLELVQELYALSLQRPKVKLEWIKAHNGWLWNEYADSLSAAWTRSQV